MTNYLSYDEYKIIDRVRVSEAQKDENIHWVNGDHLRYQGIPVSCKGANYVIEEEGDRPIAFSDFFFDLQHMDRRKTIWLLRSIPRHKLKPDRSFDKTVLDLSDLKDAQKLADAGMFKEAFEHLESTIQEKYELESV